VKATGEDRRHPVLGIVFAMPIEAQAFARLMTAAVETRAGGLVFCEGLVAGRRVAWCIGGVGATAASRAADRLVIGHRPLRLVAAGFSGGLAPHLRRGELVRPARVTAEGADDPIPLDVRDHAPAEVGGPTVVSVDRVVCTVAAKRDLAARTAADLVDMETHAVARVARSHGLPCLAVRVISDDSHKDLPADVATLAGPASTLRRLGAVVGAVGRRPAAAQDLWRLWAHAVIDGRTLAAALAVACRVPPTVAG